MINCSARNSPLLIMETPAVENPKPATDNLQLNSIHQPQTINSDIESIPMTMSYTSLKDLLPASTPTTASPTVNNSSWHEIPIKNHLVKQAAMAYLQPAGSVPEVGRKDLFGRFKDAVREECGCLFWFNDVVVKSFRDLFSLGGRRSSSDEIGDFDCDYDYEYECDYQNVEDDYEKVD